MQTRTPWSLLVITVVLALSAAPASAQADIGWVEGQWRWENNEAGCDSAYDIRVAAGGKYILSSYTYQGRRDTSEYRVLARAPGVVRARIEGESRKDAAGDPVIWDFVQLSEDAFCWHRADWADENCTRALLRCTIIVPGREGRADAERGPPARRPRASSR